MMLVMSLVWLGVAILGLAFDDATLFVIGSLGSVVNSVGVTMVREIKGNKKGSN